eukprot:2213251-Prymnesium_polylepis.1
MVPGSLQGSRARAIERETKSQAHAQRGEIHTIAGAARKPLRSSTITNRYALGLPPTRAASIVSSNSSCKNASVETNSFS